MYLFLSSVVKPAKTKHHFQGSSNDLALYVLQSEISRLNLFLDNNNTHLLINVVIFKVFSFGLYIASSLIVPPFEAFYYHLEFWERKKSHTTKSDE
jgi:hypothetical protein